MPMTIRCPACRQTYQIRDELIGKQVRCRCGQTLTVPKPVTIEGASAPADDFLNLIDDITSREAAGAVPLPLATSALGPRLGGTRSKKRRTKTLLVGIGAVAGVLLLLCAGAAGLVIMTITPTSSPGRAGDPDAPISVDKSWSLGTFMRDYAREGSLGPEVEFDQYAMRLPRGYSEYPPDANPPTPPRGGSSRAWSWVSQATPRGSRHLISVLVFDVGPYVNARKYHESHMSDYLAVASQPNLGHKREGWLSRRYAVRIDYSLSHAGTRVTDCVHYLWFDGRRMVSLSAAAAIADGPSYLKEMEAALKTIHARQ